MNTVVRLRVVEGQRNPKLRATRREPEVCRHHADDGVVLLVEPQSLVRDSRITGKFTLPKGVAENRDVVLSGAMFIREKRSPQQRLCFESGEEIFPGANSSALLGAAASQEVCGPLLITGEALQALRFRPQIAEIRGGERHFLSVGSDLVHGHQTI